jgi:DNA-binding MarR family transcriptional regulator
MMVRQPDHVKTSEVDEPSVGVLCFVAGRAVEAAVLARLVERGYGDITTAQGRVAARIGPQGTRIGDLAEQALITKQTATALVDSLERAGYVRRVPDPSDARARLVVFAPRGLEVVRLAREVEAELYAVWRAHLGERRWRQLREALELVREVADPYR